MIRGVAVVACVVLGACNKPPPREAEAKAEDVAKKAKPKMPDAKAIIAPGIGARLVKAQRESACVQAMQVKNAIEMYRLSERDCPPSLQALVDGKFVRELPIDPWKHAYMVECDGVRFGESGPSPASQRKHSLRISVDDRRLSEHGLKMDAVTAAITPLSSGEPSVEGHVVELRSANDPEKLVDLTVSTNDAGTSLRLGDIATIEAVIPEILVLSPGPDGKPDTDDDVILGSSECK